MRNTQVQSGTFETEQMLRTPLYSGHHKLNSARWQLFVPVAAAEGTILVSR